MERVSLPGGGFSQEEEEALFASLTRTVFDEQDITAHAHGVGCGSMVWYMAGSVHGGVYIPVHIHQGGLPYTPGRTTLYTRRASLYTRRVSLYTRRSLLTSEELIDLGGAY